MRTAVIACLPEVRTPRVEPDHHASRSQYLGMPPTDVARFWVKGRARLAAARSKGALAKATPRRPLAQRVATDPEDRHRPRARPMLADNPGFGGLGAPRAVDGT
jgi:hypothetical protein